MPKLTLKDPGANYRSVAQIQDNNSLIEAAIENTISRDGTSPNQMEADLDLNSNKITNLGAPVNNTDAARKQDIDSGIGADVTTVATNITEIQTVSASIADVTAVAADLAGSDTIGDAAALLAVASPGLVAKNTSGTPVARTLTGGTGISVTNGDGGAGNPTITLDAELVDIAGITPSDGVFIIGDGSDFVGESGDTALGSLGGGATGISVFKGASESAIRTTLGLGSVSTLDVVDEDNMASDSDILVPTQQSVKAYVDSVAGAGSDISAITHADGVFIVSDGTDWVGESGATARTSMGVAIGTDVQAYNAGLQDISGLATTDGNIIVGDGANWVAESGATARTSLGLAIGTDVQAYDAGLASIAGLTTAADKMVYTTAIDTYAVTDLSSFARTVLDDATAKDARATLEVNTKYVATVSALKALTGGDFEMVEVGGHTSANDGGGGLFIWDGSDTTTDDNGFYIQPNAGGAGRWIRQAPEGVASPLWFGAVVDGSTDDSTKLQAAIDFLETHYSGGTVNLPEGSMVVDGIDLISQLTLKGMGADVSVLKLPASSSTAYPMFALSGASNNATRDSDHVVFEDFTIDGNTANQTVERWLQDWSDNSAVTDPENDYTANGGGIGDTGSANIADDNYIATSQSGSASVALTLANTTMPVATVVTATTFAAARRIRVVSAGDDSGITFAVVGTDFAGNALNETITGANAGTADGSKWFKTVTSVTPSGNTASTVEVGIEEYDIGSAASAGRRNPNYTDVKVLANFNQARAATINRLYVKNHKGTGFNDRGCLGFTVENSVFEDVGKNDGPYFPIWSQSLGTTTGDQTFFSESDGLRVRNNIATKLERGFVIFNSLAGGLIENNIVDGYGEAAIFAGNLNDAPSDTDGLITSTTPGSAGSITLDGVRVDSGTAYFTNARTITVTSAANETARTFTITGTDARGEAITDTVTGANAGEARSDRRFLTVTDVSVDAATAGAIEVGCDRIYSTAVIRGNTFRNGILTDIASYGVELNSGARDITIEDNLFEEIDEGAIAAAGVKNVTITRNTFRNCYAASLGAIPYGPFAERFGFNTGEAPIAGDAISRSSGYYITIGTQGGIGGENVLITNNFAEEERSPDAPFVVAKKSGGDSLSGYHVVTGNMLVSDTAWDVCDYTTTSLVFSDIGKLNIWNNQGDLEGNGDGYKAFFTDLTVDTDGFVYNSATGNTGVGTATPTRKFEVKSSNNVPARFVSTAASVKFRMVASGTATGANEPEISVTGNTLTFRTNNLDHLQCDGAGNVNAPSGVYEVSGTQVVGSQGAAIASLTNSTGGTTDGTLAAISGTAADADLNNNFSELHTKLDAVLSALRTHGLIAT